jgi:transglutaminase-like putative cysteine protease
MDTYLKSTDVIDWQHSDVLKLARTLSGDNTLETAKRCFEWVRDEIRHSGDYHLNPVTCSASEVISAGTGFCYAKSHLLAALLRANGIPTGLCYQRLSRDNNEFCLHGLNAVYLPETGWYRIDSRGNKSTANAQFVPPVEQLAFAVNDVGEANLPGVWADPLPIVVSALRANHSYDALLNNLPDLQLDAPEFSAVQYQIS